MQIPYDNRLPALDTSVKMEQFQFSWVSYGQHPTKSKDHLGCIGPDTVVCGTFDLVLAGERSDLSRTAAKPVGGIRRDESWGAEIRRAGTARNSTYPFRIASI